MQKLLKIAEMEQVKLSAFFCVFFLWVPVAKATEAELRSFRDVEHYLKTNPSASMEKIISLLSPDLRKNYQLVYQSRSTMKGSLEKPRVILSSPDGTRIVAFGGDPQAKGGMQMEFIEQNPTSKKLEFKLVEFGEKTAKAHSNPASCIVCHASQGIKGEKILRPIWDTYPDWPGVFGSSHNNYIMERPGGGASGIPDLEFEIEAFQKFKKAAAQNDRYRHLLGLEQLSTEQLAERGTLFNDRLMGLNNESVFAHIQEKIESIRKHPSLDFRVKKAEEIDLVINQYFLNREAKTFSEAEIERMREKFASDLQQIKGRQMKHYESKLNRLKKILEEHATSAEDLKTSKWVVIQDNHVLKYRIQTLSAPMVPERSLPTLRYEKLLETLDLDPGASSIAFEPMSSVTAPGDPDHMSKLPQMMSENRVVEEVHRQLKQNPIVTPDEYESFHPKVADEPKVSKNKCSLSSMVRNWFFRKY